MCLRRAPEKYIAGAALERGCSKWFQLRGRSNSLLKDAVLWDEPLLFPSSSCSIVLKRLSGPRSRPTTPQKIW
jgi:hypothetical protein